jgi:hypothetical protein
MLVKTRDFFFCLSRIQDLLGMGHKLTLFEEIDNPKIFILKPIPKYLAVATIASNSRLTVST